LNCNLLPRSAFADAGFDESILYGYEDMDRCARLVSLGYRIRYEPQLVNILLPPKRSADLDKNRFVMAERARFCTSVKRYLSWKRNWWKLAAYAVIAPVHRAIYAIETGKWFELQYGISDMFFALHSVVKVGSACMPIPGGGAENSSASG
jgi:GT2 family glycosyltransferase